MFSKHSEWIYFSLWHVNLNEVHTFHKTLFYDTIGLFHNTLFYETLLLHDTKYNNFMTHYFIMNYFRLYII